MHIKKQTFTVKNLYFEYYAKGSDARLHETFEACTQTMPIQLQYTVNAALKIRQDFENLYDCHFNTRGSRIKFTNTWNPKLHTHHYTKWWLVQITTCSYGISQIFKVYRYVNATLFAVLNSYHAYLQFPKMLESVMHVSQLLSLLCRYNYQRATFYLAPIKNSFDWEYFVITLQEWVLYPTQLVKNMYIILNKTVSFIHSHLQLSKTNWI